MSTYEHTKVSIKRKRARFIKEYKTGVPCDRCGEYYPSYVYDFHHRDPDKKEFGLGYGSYRMGWDRIVKEVAKCDLLCANCHRIVEHCGMEQ